MTRLTSRRAATHSSVALAVAAALSAAAHAAPAPALALSPAPGPMIAMTTLQEVIVTGKALQLKSLKQRSIYESAYGDKALDRQQLKSAGVVGGAAQALSFAPGISVSGYGQTGGTKASISVNGLKQGWGGFSGGTVDDVSIAVSFDGIPMVNAATGLWETPEVPQTGIL
ncbi:MAG: TonB-dependent receptor, partial [Pseudomonadota bacterium]|nr:TonB-dependent receptor [Pseudomonadota bacterium]